MYIGNACAEPWLSMRSSSLLFWGEREGEDFSVWTYAPGQMCKEKKEGRKL